EKGFNQTSIQDIVKALEVTKGTFYYYFSSKEQLLMDIHHDYITHLLERQERIISKTNMTQKEKLTEIIRLLIMDIADQGSNSRVCIREELHLTEAKIETTRQRREKFRLRIEKIVQEGINQ